MMIVCFFFRTLSRRERMLFNAPTCPPASDNINATSKNNHTNNKQRQQQQKIAVTTPTVPLGRPCPFPGVQRAMMEAMQRALEVPHMTFCDEVNADRLSLLRADLKEAADRRGVRLSYLPLIVKVGFGLLSLRVASVVGGGGR